MPRVLGITTAIMVVALGAWGAAAAPRCDKPFTEIFRDVGPAVVRIFSVTIDPYSVSERVNLAVGSGVVIDDRANVVTNAHLVFEASQIMIARDDNMHAAEVVGLDPISDLAVIRASEEGLELAASRLGDSDRLEVGEAVLAIGYPYGLGMTATRGIISGVERVIPISPMSWLTPMLQTDAAIHPGNSGGPLVDRCGAVVGISTLTGGVVGGINFAIPSNIVSELLPSLLEKGRVVRPWHGIHGRMVPPVLFLTMGIVPGFLVETVEPGSPAEKVGLRGGRLPITIGAEDYLLGGDVITKVNGVALSELKTVARVARSLKVGDKVTFEYWREGVLESAEVTLPERPILPGDVRRFRERRAGRR